MNNNQNQNPNQNNDTTIEEDLSYDRMGSDQMTQDQSGKKGGRADDNFDFDTSDYSQEGGQSEDQMAQDDTDESLLDF